MDLSRKRFARSNHFFFVVVGDEMRGSDACDRFIARAKSGERT